jgi:competence protein ComEA
VIHVAGAVQRSGIIELRAGSRIHEAIAAAGGGTADADLDQLNLAALMEDGQKLLVPRIGEQLPAGAGSPTEGASSAGGSPGGGRINLNTASAEELGTLPRVGPVLAQRIVDWRTHHGRFTNVEELDAVDGVGPKMLEALLPLVTV